VDWVVEDPSGKPIEEVRPIRDDLERRVRALLAELGDSTGGTAAREEADPLRR
jgi:hypothetical protein